ncbi:hypothetical protein [Paenacidovorax monticola]|uniref:Uncharacterized protein n=1 Tax=Paenacidovorax monticola TaxID=1926868 RepID=A0A7H0HBC8_9BURK|nr:hypothetical protein [Paenacidovorax monticola]QNP57844.1 hypothetical protein H9L24_11945 [Paenacidovorax monticola]
MTSAPAAEHAHDAPQASNEPPSSPGNSGSHTGASNGGASSGGGLSLLSSEEDLPMPTHPAGGSQASSGGSNAGGNSGGNGGGSGGSSGNPLSAHDVLEDSGRELPGVSGNSPAASHGNSGSDQHGSSSGGNADPSSSGQGSSHAAAPSPSTPPVDTSHTADLQEDPGSKLVNQVAHEMTQKNPHS